MCSKSIIISELDVLRRLAPTEAAGVFKARQYAAAIKTLEGLPTIRSMDDLPPATKGDGLGEQIRKKIQRILEVGPLDIAPDQRAKADALDIFLGIYGVGPKKAEDLVSAGYHTLADLSVALAANPKLLNRNQVTGLKYYDDLQERIPRSEMDVHATTLMAAKPAALEGVIVGSYRRGRPDSGDIDMLLTCPSGGDTGHWLEMMIASLKKTGYLREVLAQGSHKCLAICELSGSKARRLDLLVIDPAEYPFAVLYFTGSDGFNVQMRSWALGRGFTLNEHALTQVSSGKTVKGIRTESDIFSALRLEWREPTERTGAEAVVPRV